MEKSDTLDCRGEETEEKGAGRTPLAGKMKSPGHFSG